MSGDYVLKLRKTRAVLIATALKEGRDSTSFEIVNAYDGELDWSGRASISIDSDAWDYVTGTLKQRPQLVFCHPDMLKHDPRTSLYYRGLSTLSLKAIRDYGGSVDRLERGMRSKTLNKAKEIATAYNEFICAVINGVEGWGLEDGKRAVIATVGITLDGVMRNKIGEAAEALVRKLLVQWAFENGLVMEPKLTDEALGAGTLPKHYQLTKNIEMTFGSDPDVSFHQTVSGTTTLACIVEIKGGIDPAGALERYGAATKTFQNALKQNPKCQNFFLSAVFTAELSDRIDVDRLVTKSFNLLELVEDKDKREAFFKELFHFALRMV